jgi:hypothetical protein
MYMQGIANRLPFMRRFAACVTLLVCAGFGFECCASAQLPSSASIVGRWRSLETSKGGIGTIIEFRSDGTVDFSPGAVVEMPWHIENSQIILPPATDGGADRKANLKWLGDNNLSLVSEDSVISLARVGDHANTGISFIGEWIEIREMAGRKLEAHWLVYPGGKLLFLMPFATLHGSYTISGSRLQIIVRGLKPEHRFEFSDNQLILSEPDGGHKDRYARY